MKTIMHVGPDPFDRGELTVFYRDSNVRDGTEVFYMWACWWRQDHPDIPIPPDGHNILPPLPPPRPPCVPWVLSAVGSRPRGKGPDWKDPREEI